MAFNIPPGKMAEYRAGARRREAARQAEIDARFASAWEAAQEGAEILKSQFQAEKVVVFGSLLDRRLFHQRSDVDLAAWGIREEQYLMALSRLSNISSEISVDLIRVEEAPERLYQRIITDGKAL
jgi:uncharacterized protein